MKEITSSALLLFGCILCWLLAGTQDKYDDGHSL